MGLHNMGKQSRLGVWTEPEIDAAIQMLLALRSDMLRMETRFSSRTQALPMNQRSSATNLIHYVALRGHDVRQLQKGLSNLGVSSLGNSEDHVLDDIDCILGVLRRLERSPSTLPTLGGHRDRPPTALETHTDALLGPKPTGRNVRIMVTAPAEAATDYELIHQLLQHGMNCLRINCAYDSPEVWSRMIANLRRAQKTLAKPCTLLMDIAGPKLRLGSIEPGPRVIRIRPLRDALGRIVRPARVWITAAENRVQPSDGADGFLLLPAKWLATCAPGDLIRFKDARGSNRTMRIVAAEGPDRWAELSKTAYIVPETDLYLHHHTRTHPPAHVLPVRPIDIPAQIQTLTLRAGDTFVLTRAVAPGRPAIYDNQGRVLLPATASLTLPEIFDQVRPGEPIWFDDGKIGGIIRTVDSDAISVEITHTPAEGRTLEADKGINLPDSNLHLPALTDRDRKALEFIVQHADLVGYSFVRDDHDVRELQRSLADLGGGHLGIILKIETRKAFESLPELLLSAMRGGPAGVMIARGDLAIECGFERLSEVQEEILWFAEAAHVPVIWATQVLERLAKDGIPSRAEITDAAMAGRAECVMLNKGPYILDAVRSLDDILRRMETHQAKKRFTMRRLKLATKYRANRPATGLPLVVTSDSSQARSERRRPQKEPVVRTARRIPLNAPCVHRKAGSPRVRQMVFQ